MGTLIFLGVFWGIPMYLVDRRARYNDHSPGRRLFIAVLMIWWGLIIPALIALALAGPGRRRGPVQRLGGRATGRVTNRDSQDSR